MWGVKTLDSRWRCVKIVDYVNWGVMDGATDSSGDGNQRKGLPTKLLEVWEEDNVFNSHFAKFVIVICEFQWNE